MYYTIKRQRSSLTASVVANGRMHKCCNKIMKGLWPYSKARTQLVKSDLITSIINNDDIISIMLKYTSNEHFLPVSCYISAWSMRIGGKCMLHVLLSNKEQSTF